MSDKWTFDHVTVVNVVDGDTLDIVVDMGFAVTTHHRMRLARINTPERGQPGYQEATDFVKNAALNRVVTIVTTKLDKWGRYLCELIVDGVNINDQLLQNGLAKVYA